jgi:S1-C subfamily serine protease
MDAPVGLVRALLPMTVHVAVRVPATHPSAQILGSERLGSGVVVDAAGLILTVNYVVMGARRLRVTLPDGRRVAAEVAAQDFESGLALLRARIPDPPVATLGSSETLAPGASVFTVASTGQRERRVAGGVVVSLGEFDAYWEYLLERGIVSSAANPGFGGGPLFDMRGSLVGIVSLNLNEIGRQSFAIPIEYFTRHRGELVRYGRVVSRPRRAWIGLFPQPVEEGLVVAGLVPRGPGERGGLREGDLILRVDHEEVDSRRGLYALLWRRQPGERVLFEVMRDHRLQRVEVVGEDRSEFYGTAPERSEPAGDDPGSSGGPGSGPRDRR